MTVSRTRYMNDTADVQLNAIREGRTPDDIRTWCSRQIAYHSTMLPKWERATPWFPIDPDPPAPD